MSITDVAPSRMLSSARPAHMFGARRMPPPLPRPEAQPWLPHSLRLDWQQLRPNAGAFLRIASRNARRRLEKLLQWFKPSEAATREAAIRAILQSDFSATCVRILAYLGALAVLAVGAAEIFRSAPMAAGMERVPPPEWITVVKPFPAFSLPMAELADSAYSYGMRRHATGGGRQDVMRWGTLDGAEPHLMIEVYRPAEEFTGFAGIRHEIAARADGAVEAAAVTPAGDMESKFGPVALAEFAVDRQRQCLGFVRTFDRPRLQILGWYCTGGATRVEREPLACAIDRLTLLAAASDASVGELFARAELKRNFCGQKSPLLYATPKLGPSAALSPDTKLRGRFSR